MTQRKKGLFFMPHILGHSLKASRFLNALLAAALDSSPCVSLNINMSAPVCFISLNTESSPFPSLSKIPLTFWQYILVYDVSSITMSLQACPYGMFSSCVRFVFNLGIVGAVFVVVSSFSLLLFLLFCSMASSWHCNYFILLMMFSCVAKQHIAK